MASQAPCAEPSVRGGDSAHIYQTFTTSGAGNDDGAVQDTVAAQCNAVARKRPTIFGGHKCNSPYIAEFARSGTSKVRDERRRDKFHNQTPTSWRE